MRQRVLLDTGPLVAFLKQKDEFHEWVKAEWAKIAPPSYLYNGSAVLTLDSNFQIYRKGKNQIIPVIIPLQ